MGVTVVPPPPTATAPPVFVEVFGDSDDDIADVSAAAPCFDLRPGAERHVSEGVVEEQPHGRQRFLASVGEGLRGQMLRMRTAAPSSALGRRLRGVEDGEFGESSCTAEARQRLTPWPIAMVLTATHATRRPAGREAECSGYFGRKRSEILGATEDLAPERPSWIEMQQRAARASRAWDLPLGRGAATPRRTSSSATSALRAAGWGDLGTGRSRSPNAASRAHRHSAGRIGDAPTRGENRNLFPGTSDGAHVSAAVRGLLSARSSQRPAVIGGLPQLPRG